MDRLSEFKLGMTS